MELKCARRIPGVSTGPRHTHKVLGACAPDRVFWDAGFC